MWLACKEWYSVQNELHVQFSEIFGLGAILFHFIINDTLACLFFDVPFVIHFVHSNQCNEDVNKPYKL